MVEKMSDQQVSNRGISLFGALGILFVALKLTHVIDWAWVWVTVPFWGIFVLIAVIFFTVSLAFAVISVVKWIWKKGY